MLSTIFCQKNKNLAKMKATQLLILFFEVLSALATSVADGSIKTIATNNITSTANATKVILPSSPKSPARETFVYAWGHNTKYSSVLFDENIIVKGSTLLDVKYPKNVSWIMFVIWLAFGRTFFLSYYYL